jgi:hypothetical protein
MTGFLLGAAMLVSTGAAAPAPEAMQRVTPAPIVVTFDLPVAAAAPMASYRQADERRWRTTPARSARAPKSQNLAARIIGIAAGASVGFIVGGYIGGSITDRSKENPDDDVSVLKGIMIGAPIGGVLGGILGWKATK